MNFPSFSAPEPPCQHKCCCVAACEMLKSGIDSDRLPPARAQRRWSPGDEDLRILAPRTLSGDRGEGELLTILFPSFANSGFVTDCTWPIQKSRSVIQSLPSFPIPKPFTRFIGRGIRLSSDPICPVFLIRKVEVPKKANRKVAGTLIKRPSVNDGQT